MIPEVNNSRLRSIVRWAPLLFGITSVWALLSWRHQFASISYLLACILVGLVCGALIIADLRPDSSPLLYLLWFLIFLSAPTILGEFLFADLKAKGMMEMSHQYISVVLSSILGLFTILRRRILVNVARHDAEQPTAADVVP